VTKLTRLNTQALLLQESILSSYEKQYNQLVQETTETDLGIMLERLINFEADTRSLVQMDKDWNLSNESLEEKRITLEKQFSELRNW